MFRHMKRLNVSHISILSDPFPQQATFPHPPTFAPANFSTFLPVGVFFPSHETLFPILFFSPRLVCIFSSRRVGTVFFSAFQFIFGDWVWRFGIGEVRCENTRNLPRLGVVTHRTWHRFRLEVIFVLLISANQSF